jgi:hypothetical protein
LVPSDNADGSWELFLWTPSGIQQLTSTGPSGVIAIGPPSVSNDGQFVVFSSSLDLTGGNGDGNYEVFLLELPGTFTQVTSTTGSGPTGILNDGPVVSGNGQVVAFSSAADLLGTNADGSVEVYTWQPSTGFQQITDTLTSNGFPSINGSGTALAHLSSSDLVPPQNADGSSEIFLQTPPTTSQITSTLPSDFVDHPRLSQNAARLVFASNADLVPPGNADHSVELFLSDQSSGTSQLTSALGAGFIGFPSSDSSAVTVLFQSNRDLVPPQNPDGNSEIFVWRSLGGLTQLTNTLSTNHNTNPTSSLSGSIFAYESVTALQRSVVLVGCQSQIAEVPTLASGAQAALALMLGALALLVLRCRAA